MEDNLINGWTANGCNVSYDVTIDNAQSILFVHRKSHIGVCKLFTDREYSRCE